MKIGVTNPEIFGFMGVLEEDVGPDTISDMTTNSLLGVLQEITLNFCKKYAVPTGRFVLGLDEYELLINPLANGHGFLLVPKDVLRELPVATDWSDIDRVVQHNAVLRKMVNGMIGNIAKAPNKRNVHLRLLPCSRKARFKSSSRTSWPAAFTGMTSAKTERMSKPCAKR